MDRTSASSIDDSMSKQHRTRSRPPRGGFSRIVRAAGTMRVLFFTGAALWSFVLGAGFLAATQRLRGADLTLGPDSLTLLVVGACLAGVSGAVFAQAYKEWRRRLR